MTSRQREGRGFCQKSPPNRLSIRPADIQHKFRFAKPQIDAKAQQLESRKDDPDKLGQLPEQERGRVVEVGNYGKIICPAKRQNFIRSPDKAACSLQRYASLRARGLDMPYSAMAKRAPKRISARPSPGREPREARYTFREPASCQ